jgi:hypothetical protein
MSQVMAGYRALVLFLDEGRKVMSDSVTCHEERTFLSSSSSTAKDTLIPVGAVGSNDVSAKNLVPNSKVNVPIKTNTTKSSHCTDARSGDLAADMVYLVYSPLQSVDSIRTDLCQENIFLVLRKPMCDVSLLFT